MCTAVKDDGVTLDELLFLFFFFPSLSPLSLSFSSFLKTCSEHSCTFVSYPLRVTVENMSGAKVQGQTVFTL